MHKIVMVIGQASLLFASLSGAAAFAADVRCEIKVSGTVNTAQVAQSADPYQYKTLDLDGGYRFSMQYLASGKLKTYVYHESKQRYVLIHLGEHMIKGDICEGHSQALGINRIYSPKLERELIFQCAPVCANKDGK
jgi:hypothetical protein